MNGIGTSANTDNQSDIQLCSSVLHIGTYRILFQDFRRVLKVMATDNITDSLSAHRSLHFPSTRAVLTNEVIPASLLTGSCLLNRKDSAINLLPDIVRYQA